MGTRRPVLASGVRELESSIANAHRDGDGHLLAEYERNELYFQAKLTGLARTTFRDDDMHLLEIKLHFMKPFSGRKRYQGANAIVHVSKSSADEPRIVRIAPEANSLHISDLEVTTGEKIAVGGGGNGGPAQANVNVEHSKGVKTSYEGARVIHGLIKGSDTAAWRFFEDSASATGLPPVIHLLLVVCCASDFSLDLEMSVMHRS
jgi:hypothetical protein